MSEAESGTTKQPDPMEKFRELRDAYLQIWSKDLIGAVNTEGYAQASGAAMESYLNLSTPFREATDQAMLRTLQQLNMPTSADFAGLAGRITNIEMQLDNMDAKLDRIEKRPSNPLSITPTIPTKPTRSAVQAESIHKSAKISPESRELARVPRAAKKAATKKQSVLRAAGTSRRTTSAKPLRRNVRKGTN